ncbi:hypothetical protein IG631_11555 [Alternaria alternata]|nr:hypothetical protein IG631_11555 [Alternaria alternata]
MGSMARVAGTCGCGYFRMFGCRFIGRNGMWMGYKDLRSDVVMRYERTCTRHTTSLSPRPRQGTLVPIS